MVIEYVEGSDVTNNKHLAEAINMTREGSIPPGGSHNYDDVQYPNGEVQTNRDSCFFVAIEELEKIDSAPTESQEEIDEVLRMLREVQNASQKRQSLVMADAHGILQDIWVPPTEDKSST